MSDEGGWHPRRRRGSNGGTRSGFGQGAAERPQKATPEERRARRAEETDAAVVLAAAVRALEARQLSISELQTRLRLAGYPGGLIDGTLTRLTELGYLDDDAFARAWVESRDRARPRGERALRFELGRRGVERAVVDAVLEDRRAPENGPGAEESDDIVHPDEAAAERLIARHAAALARVADPRARRQRAYGLLARNGFGPDIAARVARLVDATSAEEPLEEA